jgi:hypothetical protein
MQETTSAEKLLSGPRHELNAPDLWVRVFVVASWALLAVAIACLDWSNAWRIHYAINVVGMAGLVATLIWFFVDRNWKYAVITASAVLISLHLLRWTVHVYDAYAADPEMGVGTALGRIAQLLAARFAWHERGIGIGPAILHIYWDIVVVPVQVVVIGVLLGHRRRSPDGKPARDR